MWIYKVVPMRTVPYHSITWFPMYRKVVPPARLFQAFREMPGHLPLGTDREALPITGSAKISTETAHTKDPMTRPDAGGQPASAACAKHCQPRYDLRLEPGNFNFIKRRETLIFFSQRARARSPSLPRVEFRTHARTHGHCDFNVFYILLD